MEGGGKRGEKIEERRRRTGRGGTFWRAWTRHSYGATVCQTDCKAGVRHPNVRQDVFKPDVFNDPHGQI